jgi:hypothetical protein
MADILTPPPPTQQRRPDEYPRRAHFRAWQIAVALITVFLNVWLFTLHVVLGIAFAYLAKHILVGVLAAGLHYPQGIEEFTQPAQEGP